jgi:pimeloyl-ACP methyl ester carboxylesterase
LETRYLERPDGTLSYDDNGVDGPLVIAAPGMGDLRHSYRHVRAPLEGAGIRLVTMDLRGMGDSSTDWTDLDDAAVASDYLALIEELGAGPAVLVGNSLSCASAVLAATDDPDAVAGMALLGPFVREVPMKWWQAAAFRGMLSPPWGRSAWVGYYRRNLYPGTKPPDHDEYVQRLDANLREPGRFSSFRRITNSSHAESGGRLSDVSCPVTVIMGTADPDFPDPMAEAREIADMMDAALVWSEGSGHYPQAQTPGLVVQAIVDLTGEARGIGNDPSA